MIYLILFCVMLIAFVVYRYLVVHVLKQKNYNFFLDLFGSFLMFGSKDADDESNKERFRGVKGQAKELAYEWILNILLGVMIVSAAMIVLLFVSRLINVFSL